MEDLRQQQMTGKSTTVTEQTVIFFVHGNGGPPLLSFLNVPWPQGSQPSSITRSNCSGAAGGIKSGEINSVAMMNGEENDHQIMTITVLLTW